MDTGHNYLSVVYSTTIYPYMQTEEICTNCWNATTHYEGD